MVPEPDDGDAPAVGDDALALGALAGPEKGAALANLSLSLSGDIAAPGSDSALPHAREQSPPPALP